MKALITGANKGIGFEIARQLGQHGYELLVGARDEGRGQAAVEKLQAEGFTAQFVKVDLNDLKSLSNLSTLSGIDILVNNAGTPGNTKSDKKELDMWKPAFAYTTADLRETINVNFLGTHEVILSLLNSLTPEAKIISVTIPISGNPYWQPLAYITSKAALNSMIMAFGYQFIKDGSKRQIFGIMPGAVATDLNGEEAGDMFKTAEEAGKLIVGFLLDGKNHNAKIINFDGKEITSYEFELADTAIEGAMKIGSDEK